MTDRRKAFRKALSLLFFALATLSLIPAAGIMIAAAAAFDVTPVPALLLTALIAIGAPASFLAAGLYIKKSDLAAIFLLFPLAILLLL